MLSELKKVAQPKSLLNIIGITALIPIINILIVAPSYAFNNYFEVFFRATGNIAALSFPLILTAVFAIRMFQEKKNAYLAYVEMRINLKQYYLNKVFVATVVGFFVGMIYVLIPALISFVIAPLTKLIPLQLGVKPTAISEPFNYFVKLGVVPFVLIYALWVGLAGAIYSFFAQVIAISVKNVFLGFFGTTLFYLVFEVFTQLIPNLRAVSPVNTLFPFSSWANTSVWVLFMPLLFVLAISAIILRGDLHGEFEI